MFTFFKRHKLLSTVFLALLFSIIAFEIGTYVIAPVRLDEPISLSPPGRVEKGIMVPLAEVLHPEPHLLIRQTNKAKSSGASRGVALPRWATCVIGSGSSDPLVLTGKELG